MRKILSGMGMIAFGLILPWMFSTLVSGFLMTDSPSSNNKFLPSVNPAMVSASLAAIGIVGGFIVLTGVIVSLNGCFQLITRGPSSGHYSLRTKTYASSTVSHIAMRSVLGAAGLEAPAELKRREIHRELDAHREREPNRKELKARQERDRRDTLLERNKRELEGWQYALQERTISRKLLETIEPEELQACIDAVNPFADKIDELSSLIAEFNGITNPKHLTKRDALIAKRRQLREQPREMRFKAIAPQIEEALAEADEAIQSVQDLSEG